MRPKLQSWSVPLLLAGAVAAQGTVGLSFVSGPTVSTAFSPATLGNGITNVAQVSMIPHPTGARDTWLGGMSVTGLSTALGGLGSYDVVAFTYNRGTNVVTLNANAALFNTTGAEFALNWGRDGTYAVADRPTGVFQALAGVPGGLLAVPIAVAGIGAAYVDPCPSRIGGSNVLFYVNPAGGLAWRVHDVPTATLTGPTNIATAAPAGGNLAHSPWPMVGSDGDAEGLIACEANSTFSQSEWNWQGDLNPTTSPIAQQPTPGSPFENNGCEAFGRVYMPQSTAGYSVLEFDVVGLLGDSVPAAGGTLELTAFSPAKNAGTPDVTIFVISASYLPAPLPIAGINNALGIDPLTVVVLGIATHNTASGRGVYSTPTPPLGVGVIPVQGVTFIGGGGVHFTSTAAITIVP